MRFTIARKLWIGFSTLNVLLLVAGAIAILSLYALTGKYQSIIGDNFEKINLASEIEKSQIQAESQILAYVSFNDPEVINKIHSSLQQGATAFEKLSSMVTDEESSELIEKVNTNFTVYKETNNKVIEMKEKGKPFVSSLAQLKTHNEQIVTYLSQLVAFQQEAVEQAKADINSFKSTIFTLIVVIIIASIALGLSITVFISRNIANPIKKVTTGLDEIANGNLLIDTIHIKNKDEVGLMAETFNKMLTDLKSIVGKVRDSSSQLAVSAEELSASSEQSLASSQMVATSTEQQLVTSDTQVKLMVSSVDAMRELNTGMNQISESNEEMLRSSDNVHKLVSKGSTVITDVANQMETIHQTFNETNSIMVEMEKHSNEIQNITSLITEISEQTNLLALNAAIEAARAGDYGKGFAVVANEVKKLAEQSKNSADEIQKMINQIQKASGDAVQAITNGGVKVNEGITKTNESLHVFKEIESSVEDVIDKVESVSAAIEEIHAIADSVTESVIKVETLAKDAAAYSNDSSAATEQQLAVNQEISSSAHSLADLAEKLQQEVSKFKL
ncbi:MAG TPA: methyl-accepting chemotaxis protein [Ureibacillus sp.]|nr:methyl-accepting chemotaxis protein [Ureibacillus sp.]